MPRAAVESDTFRQVLVDAKGRGVRTRIIVEMTKDNTAYCRELMKFANVRHLNGARGNFGVSDSEYAATGPGLMQEQAFQQTVHSNVRTIVKQHQYLFDTLWNNATLGEQRIGEIEGGIEPVHIEVIQDPKFTLEVLKNLVKAANQEILLILPTVRSFIRHEKTGMFPLLTEAASKRGVKVRIIMVKDELIRNSMQAFLGRQEPNIPVDIRFIKKEEASFNKAKSLLVDRKSLLIVELEDDSKDTFVEAIGFSTYSNSDPGIVAYISMFEDLWMQSQLYEQMIEVNAQLANANEQLKVHDKMQREFINVAAHELKTPLQPILGAIDIIKLRIQMMQSEGRGTLEEMANKEELDIIFRNVKRLEHLSSDILDVTRMESSSLNLNKTRFNLDKAIANAVMDANQQVGHHKKNFKINYDRKEHDIVVFADSYRISQVCSNLLNNAIKFGGNDGGNIITIASEFMEDREGPGVLVTIKDSGTGIDAAVLPRLFAKFSSSPTRGGTGLGLYISKKIIEAHGGRIWASNNTNGRGATFSFILPLNI